MSSNASQYMGKDRYPSPHKSCVSSFTPYTDRANPFSLFSVVFAVLFFIVRKKRQQTKRDEESAQQKIDMDDNEERAAFRMSNKR